MEHNRSITFLKAQRRVDHIKKFYKHLVIYVIANLLLLIFKFQALEFFAQRGIGDQGFLNWFEWNIIGTPIIWGVVLALHAIYVFVLLSKPLKELTPRFYKDWEERRIKEFMEEDDRARKKASSGS